MDPTSIVKQDYERVAKAYTKRYGDSPFLLKNIKKFSSRIPKEAKILDLGCGSGRAAALYAKKGFKVTGVDFSNEMLRIAKKRVKNAKFKKMDIRNLNFPDKYFDGVWSSFSLLHIPKVEVKKVLSESKRVLKDNGLLFISVSLGNDKEVFKNDWLEKNSKVFFYLMSKRSLVKYLKESKFKISEVGIEKDSEENGDHPILFVYANKF